MDIDSVLVSSLWVDCCLLGNEQVVLVDIGGLSLFVAGSSCADCCLAAHTLVVGVAGLNLFAGSRPPCCLIVGRWFG